MITWQIIVAVLVLSALATAAISMTLRGLRSEPLAVDLEASRERDTLPPGPEVPETDLIVATIERLDRVTQQLTIVSKELTGISRDILFVGEQQRSHGKEIGALRTRITELENDVSELKRKCRCGT